MYNVILIVFTYFRFLMSLQIVCILYFFFKFYEILFEDHTLYEKVISIKIIITIIIDTGRPPSVCVAIFVIEISALM